MTSTGFPTLTTRTSYWQVSRAPRYSLLFALPLLVFYQVLAVLLAHGARSVRNGADVILEARFTAVAGAWGPPLFMVCLIGAGLWLVTRDLRAHGSRLRSGVLAAMLGESIALALIFGFAVGRVTSGVLGMLQTLAVPGGPEMDWWTRLMVSLGAGIYEELLFRVLLVGALATAARALLGWRPLTAGVAATFAGAVFGSSSTNTIQRGYLYGARRSFTNALSSASSVGLAEGPRASTTNASGFTSSSLSSAPTTPASTTAGCSASALSTSAGDTHMPPALIMSSVRPAYQEYPSASRWYLSPVRTHSPSIVCLVRSCWFQ